MHTPSPLQFVISLRCDEFPCRSGFHNIGWSLKPFEANFPIWWMSSCQHTCRWPSFSSCLSQTTRLALTEVFIFWGNYINVRFFHLHYFNVYNGNLQDDRSCGLKGGVSAPWGKLVSLWLIWLKPAGLWMIPECDSICSWHIKPGLLGFHLFCVCRAVFVIWLRATVTCCWIQNLPTDIKVTLIWVYKNQPFIFNRRVWYVFFIVMEWSTMSQSYNSPCSQSLCCPQHRWTKMIALEDKFSPFHKHGGCIWF